MKSPKKMGTGLPFPSLAFLKFPFPAALLLLLFLAGCLGPKKINQWVDTQYGQNLNTPPKMKTDYLSVSSGLASPDPAASVTTKQTKNFLPLLFYYKFDYINTCALNAKIPFNTFSAAVQSYANAKGLKKKLNGQKLELTIDQVPSTFQLYDKGHLIWLVLYAHAWDNITYRPDTASLNVSYRIVNDNVETKKGTVSVPNIDKILQLKFMQSTRKATYQYLAQYDESIKLMARKVIDQVIADL